MGSHTEVSRVWQAVQTLPLPPYGYAYTDPSTHWTHHGDTYKHGHETPHKDMEIKTQRQTWSHIQTCRDIPIYRYQGISMQRYTHLQMSRYIQDMHTDTLRYIETHKNTLIHTHGDTPRHRLTHRHAYSHTDTETIYLVYPHPGSTSPLCHLTLRKTSHDHTCCTPHRCRDIGWPRLEDSDLAWT